MNTLLKSVFAAVLALTLANPASAQTKPEALLSQIDADIAAQRYSTPAGNNAIEKIFLFKSIAPYDQRVTSRVNNVGEFYVELANKAIASKDYDKAQTYLDKSWMLSYLTPGLSSAQDKLDGLFTPGSAVAKAEPVKKAEPAPKPAPQPIAKKDDAAEKAAREKALAEQKAAEARALAAKKAAEAKRQKQLAAKEAAQEKARQAALAEERRLAAQRREAEKKAQAAAKLATLKEQRERAEAMRNQEETEPALANFDLSQSMIDDRNTRQIRDELGPICQEILDNEASVVLHTKTPQDYRWLTVRLTLCVRRLDKAFRLRHSYQMADSEPAITLHPGRNISLLKKARN